MKKFLAHLFAFTCIPLTIFGPLAAAIFGGVYLPPKIYPMTSWPLVCPTMPLAWYVITGILLAFIFHYAARLALKWAYVQSCAIIVPGAAEAINRAKK